MLILATFAEVMTTVGYILIALVALLLMVVIHELGHYLAGKLFKFKILEFAVGFGPAIKKWTNKKTGEVFSIRPIPLGGFCQFEDEDETSKSPTAFNNQAPWKRLIVLFAGAFFNFISAIIIITMFFTFYGQVLPTIASVYEGSAAQEAGLMEGDVVLRYNGSQVNVLLQDDFQVKVRSGGDTGTFTVLRNGKVHTFRATKREYSYDANAGKDLPADIKTVVGFGFSSYLGPVRLGFFRSLGRSFSFIFYVVWQILLVFGRLITGQIPLKEAAGGPVAVVDTMQQATRAGLASLSFVVCLISANLAVMNLLPLPALDGSRMVFCIIEWIRGKPINKKVEGIIHTVGFFALFAFAILADVIRLVT